MILEVAVLDVKKGEEAEFEEAFAKAQAIIAQAIGYISHELQRCIEKPNRYILLVRWQSLAARGESSHKSKSDSTGLAAPM